MATNTRELPGDGWASALNLLLPGGGLILIGAPWSGLLIGLAFAACANFALAAVLLFPDNFSPTHQALGTGLAAGAYLGAQVRLAQTRRQMRAAAAAAWRRRMLWRTRELVERGEHAEALQTITPLAERWPDDLHVAYRVAQVLTEVGSADAAQDAWRRVRALDRHGLYRAQIGAGFQRLSQGERGAPATGGAARLGD